MFVVILFPSLPVAYSLAHSLALSYLCLPLFLSACQPISYHNIVVKECRREPCGRKHGHQWLEAHTLAVMNQKGEKFSQHLQHRTLGLILTDLIWIKCPPTCPRVQTYYMTASVPKGDQKIMIVPLGSYGVRKGFFKYTKGDRKENTYNKTSISITHHIENYKTYFMF